MKRLIVAWMLLCVPACAGWFQVFSQATTVAANCSPVLLHPKQSVQKLKAQVKRLKKGKRT